MANDGANASYVIKVLCYDERILEGIEKTLTLMFPRHMVKSLKDMCINTVTAMETKKILKVGHKASVFYIHSTDIPSTVHLIFDADVHIKGVYFVCGQRLHFPEKETVLVRDDTVKDNVFVFGPSSLLREGILRGDCLNVVCRCTKDRPVTVFGLGRHTFSCVGI